MATDVLATYAEILEMSRRMLSSAQSGNWEELVEQEAARQQLVEILRKQLDGTTRSTPGSEHAKINAMIRATMELDEQTQTLTERRLTDIKEALSTIGMSKRLNSTYLRP